MMCVTASVECFGKEAGDLESEWMALAALGPLKGVEGISMAFSKDSSRSRRGILGTPFVSAIVTLSGPDADAEAIREAMDISLRGLSVFAADTDREQAVKWAMQEEA